MELQDFIDKLYAAGWTSPCDAQHTNISLLWEEIGGGSSFFDLCEKLIEEDGFHRLNPLVTRTRSRWLATVYSDEEEGGELLAYGSGHTLNVACGKAVEDFKEKERHKQRKQELLKDKNVQEALALFGVELP